MQGGQHVNTRDGSLCIGTCGKSLCSVRRARGAALCWLEARRLSELRKACRGRFLDIRSRNTILGTVNKSRRVTRGTISYSIAMVLAPSLAPLPSLKSRSPASRISAKLSRARPRQTAYMHHTHEPSHSLLALFYSRKGRRLRNFYF